MRQTKTPIEALRGLFLFSDIITSMNVEQESTQLHAAHCGKLEMSSRLSVTNITELSLAYSPGVAGPCREIQKDASRYAELTSAGKTVAIISDGSAVLGLGNIGSQASMPVMEGKAVLMKEFAGLNSFPIVLDTQDTEEIISTIKHIAPSFAAINLEDISAPRCFEIERRLKAELDIPVMHDDQHGTAIVVLAGIINALKVTNRSSIADTKIVINGAGAAGVAIANLLHTYGASNIIVCDSQGIISPDRQDLHQTKQELLEYTNLGRQSGSLRDALNGADIFVGVSKADILGRNEVAAMNAQPIVFALANPHPEINPDKATEYGVAVLATGRSDLPNQVNNVLAFPGIFRGAIETGVNDITDEIKISAAEAIAALVKNPSVGNIIPGAFEEAVSRAVAQAVTNSTVDN
jgi:malate dehydrogenase (oxaloacetate-decarboxylating)